MDHTEKPAQRNRWIRKSPTIIKQIFGDDCRVFVGCYRLESTHDDAFFEACVRCSEGWIAKPVQKFGSKQSNKATTRFLNRIRNIFA